MVEPQNGRIIATGIERKIFSLSQQLQDKELIDGCLRKDRKAQKQLFEKYFSDMMAICMRYTRNEDEAKDILQEGFIKVFSKISTFSGDGSLKGWLHSIMIRTAIDHYRKDQREAKTIDYEIEQDQREEASVEAQLASEEILLIIQKLPAIQRAVFNLFAMEGFSHKEISKELNITEGTSKWHLCEARKNLKKMLELYYSVKEKEYAA
jgi:RNA polymerase sigma factor (sigma-70 family)